jgi:uncharacterized protein (TIGR00255 family)
MMNAPLRSMTGFGEAEREFETGRLRIEIRTVNHRFLNLQFRTPPGFDRYQRSMERTLKRHFVRGHVSVGVTVEAGEESDGIAPIEVDRERARAYVRAMRELQAELELEGRVEVGTLAWFRDLFRPADRDEASLPLPEGLLEEVLDEAAAATVRMREEEGARMGADLEGRLTAMEEALDGVAERAPERLLRERDRLRAAIEALLDGRSPVDEERLAREVAHLAERWDIHEEIVRFRAHLEMFRETLERGDPSGVGKRFGFVSQELLREANTIGSKANDAEIARLVVQMKEEIERLREQLENVE